MGGGMQIAEQVTFGGDGKLDRLAELRQDLAKLSDHCLQHGVKHLLFWRGKVLIDASNPEQICLSVVSHDHAILEGNAEPPILLGRRQGAVLFATDISAWEPEEMPQTLGAFHDPSRQNHPKLPPHQVFAELRTIMAGLTAGEAELAATGKAIIGWHTTHRFCACCGKQSDVAASGWQRNCPDCNASHFPRTDPVVIMLITQGNDLLLGRSPGWPEGMYSLLAGFVEPGETIEAAVRREVLEECSVTVGDVRYLASQPWPFPSSLMIGCMGKATSREITIDPAELEDAMWISRDELADVFAGTSQKILAARRGSIAQFLMANWLADRLD
jgi:NAD+ diphosphatase